MYYLLLSLIQLAQAQPSEEAWMPVLHSGSPLEEASGDVEGFDLVGTVDWQADSEVLWVRVRASESIGDQTVAWVWQGPEGPLGAWSLDASGGQGWDVSAKDPLAIEEWQASSLVVMQPEPSETTTGDALVVGVGRAEIQAMWGVMPTTELQVLAVAGPATGWSDVAVCDGICGPKDAYSDPWMLDQDEDGRTLSEEMLVGTDPEDADSDDDGLWDGEEALLDTDEDGVFDGLDCDADGDGLLDGMEAGHVTYSDMTDVSAGCWVEDSDPFTQTDPTQWDTDQGGLSDGQEDVDRDGAFEPPWETNPRDPEDDHDADEDGIPDVVELAAKDGITEDEDSDGDGLLDEVEGVVDTDEDGWPDFTDSDSDGDGLLDGVEGTDDGDGDGLPNYRDLDSDDDGWSDTEEGEVDTDRDGKPDRVDTDSDGDGVPDADERDADTDCDGLEDRVDGDDESSFCDTGQPIPGADTGPWSGPGEADLIDLKGGWFGGGGCQSAPGTPWDMWWIVLAFLVRPRRAWIALVLMGSAAANAQEVNVDHLGPTPGGRWLAAADPFAGSHRFGTEVRFDMMDDPVMYRAPSGDAVPVLERVGTTRVVAYAQASEALGMGVVLPWHQTIQGQGTGDLAVYMTGARDVGSTSRAGLNLIGTLPTGGLSWLGARRPTVEGQVVFGKRMSWGQLALSSGVRTGTGKQVGAQEAGPALTWSVGSAIDASNHLAATLESAGEHGLSAGRGGGPAEMLLGLRGSWGVLYLHMGGGLGLGGGLGAPDWRGVAALGVGALARNEPVRTSD